MEWAVETVLRPGAFHGGVTLRFPPHSKMLPHSLSPFVPDVAVQNQAAEFRRNGNDEPMRHLYSHRYRQTQSPSVMEEAVLPPSSVSFQPTE